MSDPSAHSGNTQYIGNMPSSGGGGGGGTPNVAISGTDASGLPIASPVLVGNDSLDNVTLIGGNTNTGFRSVVFGTNNTNSGDNSLVAGQGNQNSGQKNIIGGGNNSVAGYENSVSGSTNTVDSASDRNSVSGANNILDRSDSNNVSGEGNQLSDSSANDVSGYNHHLTNASIQNRVSGNNHTLNNVVNSEVSGYNHDIAPLAGTGADYNNISGNEHLVRGDYNRVSGAYNTVQTIGANVHGTGNIVEGSFSDVNGESNRVGPNGVNAHAEGNANDALGKYSHVQGHGNTAKFGQHVAGQWAEIDLIAGETAPAVGQKVEIIGWGTGNANRKSVRWLDDSGNEGIRGNHYLLQSGRSYNFGEGSNISVGSDGDLIYRHVSGQKLFNGNFLYSWTHQGGGDYSNLTVDTLTETVIVAPGSGGRNGIVPKISPRYFMRADGSYNLSNGPIWIRVRGGYGVIGANPIMTVRVYFFGASTGNQLIAEMKMDLSAFPRVVGDNTGCEYLCWIEPINLGPEPSYDLRLRAHQIGQASRGNDIAQGSWVFSENETYSNIRADEEQEITITAQWSALGSQTWAFFDGLEIFR